MCNVAHCALSKCTSAQLLYLAVTRNHDPGVWGVGTVQCTVGQSPKGMVYFLELAIVRVAVC